jgi:hypothetical protein
VCCSANIPRLIKERRPRKKAESGLGIFHYNGQTAGPIKKNRYVNKITWFTINATNRPTVALNGFILLSFMAVRADDFETCLSPVQSV